ncbi:hypothetical protein [Sphingosinicella sp. YJ22]|uniref:hypothetical protein n=1 Tax=Sphingosinicella sp. YJ22 TaxID=1104780 RepID=UPI00140AC787|nr:hypothetical protein [Sphingosinicella sp. YJ22]
MSLSSGVLITDALAIVAAVAGFHIAFRQNWVRRWLARLSNRPPPAAPVPAEDPAHYAMIIAGTMLMAFGLIMFAFTTSYALLTASP